MLIILALLISPAWAGGCFEIGEWAAWQDWSVCPTNPSNPMMSFRRRIRECEPLPIGCVQTVSYSCNGTYSEVEYCTIPTSAPPTTPAISTVPTTTRQMSSSAITDSSTTAEDSTSSSSADTVAETSIAETATTSSPGDSTNTEESTDQMATTGSSSGSGTTAGSSETSDGSENSDTTEAGNTMSGISESVSEGGDTLSTASNPEGSPGYDTTANDATTNSDSASTPDSANSEAVSEFASTDSGSASSAGASSEGSTAEDSATTAADIGTSDAASDVNGVSDNSASSAGGITQGGVSSGGLTGETSDFESSSDSATTDSMNTGGMASTESVIANTDTSPAGELSSGATDSGSSDSDVSKDAGPESTTQSSQSNVPDSSDGSTEPVITDCESCPDLNCKLYYGNPYEDGASVLNRYTSQSCRFVQFFCRPMKTGDTRAVQAIANSDEIDLPLSTTIACQNGKWIDQSTSSTVDSLSCIYELQSTTPIATSEEPSTESTTEIPTIPTVIPGQDLHNPCMNCSYLVVTPPSGKEGYTYLDHSLDECLSVQVLCRPLKTGENVDLLFDQTSIGLVGSSVDRTFTCNNESKWMDFSTGQQVDSVACSMITGTLNDVTTVSSTMGSGTDSTDGSVSGESSGSSDIATDSETTQSGISDATGSGSATDIATEGSDSSDSVDSSSPSGITDTATLGVTEGPRGVTEGSSEGATAESSEGATDSGVSGATDSGAVSPESSAATSGGGESTDDGIGSSNSFGVTDHGVSEATNSGGSASTIGGQISSDTTDDSNTSEQQASSDASGVTDSGASGATDSGATSNTGSSDSTGGQDSTDIGGASTEASAVTDSGASGATDSGATSNPGSSDSTGGQDSTDIEGASTETSAVTDSGASEALDSSGATSNPGSSDSTGGQDSTDIGGGSTDSSAVTGSGVSDDTESVTSGTTNDGGSSDSGSATTESGAVSSGGKSSDGASITDSSEPGNGNSATSPSVTDTSIGETGAGVTEESSSTESGSVTDVGVSQSSDVGNTDETGNSARTESGNFATNDSPTAATESAASSEPFTEDEPNAETGSQDGSSTATIPGDFTCYSCPILHPVAISTNGYNGMLVLYHYYDSTGCRMVDAECMPTATSTDEVTLYFGNSIVSSGNGLQTATAQCAGAWSYNGEAFTSASCLVGGVMLSTLPPVTVPPGPIQPRTPPTVAPPSNCGRMTAATLTSSGMLDGMVIMNSNLDGTLTATCQAASTTYEVFLLTSENVLTRGIGSTQEAFTCNSDSQWQTANGTVVPMLQCGYILPASTTTSVTLGNCDKCEDMQAAAVATNDEYNGMLVLDHYTNGSSCLLLDISCIATSAQDSTLIVFNREIMASMTTGSQHLHMACDAEGKWSYEGQTITVASCVGKGASDPQPTNLPPMTTTPAAPTTTTTVPPGVNPCTACSRIQMTPVSSTSYTNGFTTISEGDSSALGCHQIRIECKGIEADDDLLFLMSGTEMGSGTGSISLNLTCNSMSMWTYNNIVVPELSCGIVQAAVVVTSTTTSTTTTTTTTTTPSTTTTGFPAACTTCSNLNAVEPPTLGANQEPGTLILDHFTDSQSGCRVVVVRCKGQNSYSNMTILFNGVTATPSAPLIMSSALPCSSSGTWQRLNEDITSVACLADVPPEGVTFPTVATASPASTPTPSPGSVDCSSCSRNLVTSVPSGYRSGFVTIDSLTTDTGCFAAQFSCTAPEATEKVCLIGDGGKVLETATTRVNLSLTCNDQAQWISEAFGTITTLSCGVGIAATTTPIVVTLPTTQASSTPDCTQSTWDAWQSWSDCTSSCGACGTHQRFRACVKSDPSCLCEGTAFEKEACNFDVCKYPNSSCCANFEAKSSGGLFLCVPSTTQTTT